MQEVVTVAQKVVGELVEPVLQTLDKAELVVRVAERLNLHLLAEAELLLLDIQILLLWQDL
jgi:hypothetical protein